ncbi:diguanylate cyclase/phosphodiesterase with PAS/PAC sensor(s) [Lachnospiraceae bacterium KM106-2]|nr:diguanylate cyclase/phosphodiesterase with PAS/PAC sensor(s) [Lachnospiraceae bacterium KM106-2]
MRAANKRQFKQFVDSMEFPSLIYIYETGKIIAMNNLASDILGEGHKNLKQMVPDKRILKFSKELLSNHSRLVHEIVISINKVTLSLDVEVNCMEQEEDLHTVLLLFDHSYKQCFDKDKVQKEPRIIWKNKKLELLGLNSAAENDSYFDDQQILEYNMESLGQENIQTLQRYEKEILEKKDGVYNAYQMIQNRLNQNYFVRLSGIPMTNRYGTVIGVVLCYNLVLNREEYKQLYDTALKENNFFGEIISKSGFIVACWTWEEYLNASYVSTNVSNLGLSIEDIYNKKIYWKDILSKQTYKAVKKFVKKSNEWPNDIIEGECQIKNQQGELIWLATRTMIVRKRGEVSHFETMIHDITEKKLLEQQLNDSHKALETNTNTLKKVFDSLNSYVFIIDRTSYRLIFVNSKVAEQYGFVPINQKLDDFLAFHEIILYHTNLQYSNEYLEQCIENRVPYITFYDCRNEMLLDAQMANIEWRGIHNAIILHMHDITEQVTPAKNISIRSGYDYLTGLHNQHKLDKDLEKIFQSIKVDQKKYYFIYIDLDAFHSIQNKKGARYTDLLLQKVGKNLLQMEEIQESSYRVGGDKFYIIADYSMGEEIKDKIYEIFQRPFSLEDEMVRCTASIGISILTPETKSKRELFEHVKSALTMAKDKGRNIVCYYDEDELEISKEHLVLEEELKNALKNDRKQFCVEYQPIIESENDQVRAVEALIRWNNEKLGEVKPSHFITVAENLGLMNEIGEILIHHALEMCCQLEQNGWNIKMHINLSNIQVWNHDFMKDVINKAKELQVQTKNIVLEITECLTCTNQENLKKKYKRLVKEGFELAYDKFRGVVTFQDMLQIPFSYVKLSSTLIQSFGTNEFNGELVTTMIRYIHAMDLKAIVMGVETKEQSAFAKEQGSDMQQGIVYSKALGKEELIEYMKEHL